LGLIAQAQQDILDITTDDDGFAVPVIFTTTDGVLVVTVTCNALAIKHSLVHNDQGMLVTGRNARVSVSELALLALNYPVRDTNNNVSLKGHTVTWTDVSGVQATYQIKEQNPDESTGLIVCQLSNYGVVTPPGRLIIGWIVSRVDVLLVTVVDPLVKQTLANGDQINVQYVINNNGTLTIPYLATYNVLTPFIIDNGVLQDEPYDQPTGTFDNSNYGGFQVGNVISFNASIPVWQQS
jgi:hypothetical protein